MRSIRCVNQYFYFGVFSSEFRNIIMSTVFETRNLFAINLENALVYNWILPMFQKHFFTENKHSERRNHFMTELENFQCFKALFSGKRTWGWMNEKILSFKSEIFLVKYVIRIPMHCHCSWKSKSKFELLN